MQQETVTLDDFSKQILTPTLLSCIKSGALDHAIQSEDCQNIIDDNPELREAVDKRLEIIRCSKK